MGNEPVRASTRISIAWSGGPAGEDTDTLVLTINAYSLDLRVGTEGEAKGEIDWATVSLVSELEGSTSEKPRLRWDNLLSSRGPSEDADEGAFSTLPNGGVLETGSMLNPASGSVEAYEEIWRRLPIAPGSAYVVLQRQLSGEDMAFVAQVDGWAVGIAKVKGQIAAWREERTQEWERKYSFGEVGVIPSLHGTEGEGWKTWKTDEVVAFGGGKWEVKTAGTV